MVRSGRLVPTWELAVPSGCGALVAAVSLAFYSALVQLVSRDLAAAYIAAISLAAIVQIACVPQAWIYTFTAAEKERAARTTNAAVAETLGFLIGFAVVLPLAALTGDGVALVLAYAALGMAGSTSTLGLVRAKGDWALYALIVTFPSIARVALIGVTTLAETNPGSDPSLASLVFLYLLVPEGARYVLLHLPILLRAWEGFTWIGVRESAAHLFRNWYFDIGSAATEVADKYILSHLLSPAVLLVYFFARKISSATTIVLEPFYSARYRTLSSIETTREKRRHSTNTLRKGYAVALLVSLLTWAIVQILGMTSIGTFSFIPAAILAYAGLLALCMAIDGALAANRWGRYLSIVQNRARALLLARLACFATFIAVTWVASRFSETIGLILGFAIYAALEFFYVATSAKFASGSK